MTISENTRETIRRIKERDGSICAFREVLEQRALFESEQAEENGVGLLNGVAVVIKEVFDVAGAENSYGSMVRSGERATVDSEIVTRLRASGAIIVGTARSHEFAWGLTTQNEKYGSTRNPWNLERVPGGSSGGSAAAVAAGMVSLAVGSDTGGSIRVPAAFCGVLGLKTTWGRISRHGGLSLAPSFDSPGFFARDTITLIAAYLATAGPDWADASTLNRPPVASPDASQALLASTAFAISDDLNFLSLSKARQRSATKLRSELFRLGAREVAIESPHPSEAISAFVSILKAEAYHVHSRVLSTYPRCADLYGKDVRTKLESSEAVTLSEYIEARNSADSQRALFLRAFESANVIFNVVGSVGPSKISDPDYVVVNGIRTPLRDSVMASTIPQNVAGVPSITFPFGFDDDHMPIGIQMTGPPFSEIMLLSIASELERAGIITVPTPDLFPLDSTVAGY